MALLATLSCVKEKEHELQPEQGEERFAEFDPVVRFGLATYLGTNGDTDPFTKTTYAGDDKTVLVLDKATATKVRYERINWNVDPSDTKNPQDVVRILSEKDFTNNNNQVADYKATAVPGFTNLGQGKDDMADTAPWSGNEKDNLYWSQDKDPRYFYGVYPSPNGNGSKLDASNITLDPSVHKVKIKDAVIPANQPYVYFKDSNAGIGQSGAVATREYMPDMRNAYMFAASVVPGADAGYKKVPLRFKPLFSAIKLIVTARAGDVASDHGTYDPSKAKDFPAAKYRLAKVELRTDINENDIYLGPDRDTPVSNTNGTPLSGKFSATFKAGTPDSDGSATTGDFALEGTPTETGKRLTISIDPDDRVCLNDDTLKLTFLALPVDQQFMTVDYTFEYLLDDSLDPNDPTSWSDPTKIKTFHRTLALQNREKIFKGDDNSWYKLPAANKLYVRSAVPAIEYVFKVEAQSFFPRNLNRTVAGHDYSLVPGKTDQWVVEDFYSVVSYRDSSGVLQPLKWQVTGYSTTGADGTFDLANKPSWLAICGETFGTYNPASDIAWYYDPDNTDPQHIMDNGITVASPDVAWNAAPWGFGSRMDKASRVTTIDPSTGKQVYGYTKFNHDHTYAFYDAGAGNNGEGVRDWKKHVSANYCDQDGKYYYPVYDEDGVKLSDDIAKTPYAFDLSSHDIYGNLYPGYKNGDIVTTANCYVVSAPGWYRIPAVYGNAIKDGADNQRAYKGVGGTGLLGWFKDHNNNDITQPWISGGTGPSLITPGTDGAELVWEDANDLVDAHLFAGSEDLDRGNKQKPFYWVDNDPESPNKGNGYIYFYVNQISFSSAVLAAKSGGTTVWSWHIWCVPDPETNLKTVAIESSKYNFKENPSDETTRKPFAFESVYVDTDVWKELDLGQGRKENNSYWTGPRKIYVEFKQYWRGKAINDADARRGRVVVCFAQSGLEDQSGIKETPAYQWGRKDPMQTKNLVHVTPNVAVTDANNLGTAIQNPTTLYHGGSKQSWHTTSVSGRLDNLWNSNVNYCPTTFEGFEGKSYDPTNGNLEWYNTADVPTGVPAITVPTGQVGRRDTPVCKTIYDPCPPGYMVPNLFAFTAFNNRGMKQMRVEGSKVAWNHTWDSGKSLTEEDGTTFQNYSGFYYAFKLTGGEVEGTDDTVFSGKTPSRSDTPATSSSTKNANSISFTNFKKQEGYYRREINSEKVVLFYARGRVNGSSASTVVSDNHIGFYWLAEPASHETSLVSLGNWSYGSSFQFQKHTSTEQMRVYPVTGGNFAADAWYAANPGYAYDLIWGDYNRNHAKWQREHALYVRPMKEKDAPGLFSGSNMDKPLTGVDPF